MSTKILVILATIVFSGFTCGKVSSQIGNKKTEQNTLASNELQSDIAFLQQVQKSKNLQKFISSVKFLQDKWDKKNHRISQQLTLSVCDTLTSQDFGFDNIETKIDLAQSYAEVALNRPLEEPLHIRAKLVMTFASEYLFDSKFLQRRRQRTKLWLMVWSEIEHKINLGVSASKPAMLNVPVPNNVAPAGIDPEAINDPEIRDRYKKAIAENSRIADSLRTQSQLLSLEKRYSMSAIKYISKAYSTPPFNLPELSLLLDKYDIGKERKKRILDAVVEQMKYAVTGATSLSSTPPPLPSFEPTLEATPTPEATPQPTPSPTPQK